MRLGLKQGEEMKLWKRGLGNPWKKAYEHDEIEVRYTERKDFIGLELR